MFLEHQISISNDFWRSCDTEDWSNDAENTALITAINYILQYILTENRYFNITIFYGVWSNKCSFGKQKRLSLKSIMYVNIMHML